MQKEQQKDRSVLGRERRIVVLLALIAPFAIVSGLITWPFSGREWYWIQAVFIMHAVVGSMLAIIVLAYIAIHFHRTFGNRVFSVFSSGLLVGLITFLVAGSGLWMVLFGQSEHTRWVLPVHIYSSVFACILAVLHVIFHVRWRKQKRRGSQPLAPSLDGLVFRGPVIAFVGLVGFTALVWLSAHALNADQVTMDAPDDYGYRYGPNPMAPSETLVKDGELLHPRVLGRSFDCARCHADLHEQWRASAHAKAALDPVYERNVTLLAENKGIEATRYCEGCHAPVALLGGKLKPGGEHAGIDGTLANSEGVSCVTCHSVESVVHTQGVASYKVLAPAPYLFEFTGFALLDAVNDWLIRARPELHVENFDTERISGPEFCATCHSQYMDERMNDWGWVQMQDQYSSWLDSPYSGRERREFSNTSKKICRDCHMQQSVAVDPSSSIEGEIRNHWFPGANTFIPNETGDPEYLRRVRRFLMEDKIRIGLHLDDNEHVDRGDRFVDESIRSDQEVPDYYYLGQEITGLALVSNVGVGHKFPAGTNDIHQAWVSVKAVDASGRVLYQEGDLHENGELDASSHIYHSLKVDKHGRNVWKHDLFNMVGEQYSNVVQPGKTDVVPFSFRVPSWALSPVSVTARVNYRKFNKRYGAWVMRDDNYTAPVTVVAEESMRFEIVNRPGSDGGT